MTSSDIADLLLSINAVQLNPQRPFQFSSGLLSPIYCDNRVVISHPVERQQIIQAFLDCITLNSITCDVIAGTATAGIPHAAWLADKLEKPLIYIRSKPKSHGSRNQIEGRIKPGQRVLLIEDLISTGGSVINAAIAIREANACVEQVLCIFTYGLNVADEQLQTAKLQCFSLTNFDSMTQTAVNKGFIKDSDLSSLQRWQQNPTQWGQTLER